MLVDNLDRLLVTLAGRLHAFSICQIQDGWHLTFPAFDAITIHFVLKGSGGVRTGNGPWHPVAPRSIIVIPPRQTHALGDPGPDSQESSGGDHCSPFANGLVAFTAGNGCHDTLMVCGSIPRHHGNALGLFDLLTLPLVEDLSDTGTYQHVFDLMLAEVTKPTLGVQAMTEALMQQCFILLLRRHLLRDGGSPLFTAVQHPRLTTAVVAILENPAAPHSVESLASLVGMGRTSFAEQFSRAFGQGPIDFVQKARLCAAARLLTTTDLPVKVIAASVGYASRSYFSRAFAYAYGTDPTTYRTGGGQIQPETQVLAEP